MPSTFCFNLNIRLKTFSAEGGTHNLARGNIKPLKESLTAAPWHSLTPVA
jgi:hypothetical protein